MGAWPIAGSTEVSGADVGGTGGAGGTAPGRPTVIGGRVLTLRNGACRELREQPVGVVGVLPVVVHQANPRSSRPIAAR